MTTTHAFPKQHTFQVDDIISCEGQEFIVTKVNSVNLKARNLKTGMPWNISKYLATFVRKSTPMDHVQTVEVVKQSFVLGSVVEFGVKGLYVVVALSSDGTYRIAALGGDNNKYYRKVKASQLKSVSLAELSSRL